MQLIDSCDMIQQRSAIRDILYVHLILALFNEEANNKRITPRLAREEESRLEEGMGAQMVCRLGVQVTAWGLRSSGNPV